MLLGSAYGKIEIDASGVRRGVTDAKNSLKTLQAAGVEVGRTMQDVGKKLTVGLTLPILAMGAASIKAASDFEETRNKAMVVFEDMANSVTENADKSARALGINKEAYLDYASSIGAALKAGGMGIAETTKLSEQAVKHFADLASFHNAQVEDVARAWESAIRGQYEPIQRYFPFITNEYLKTYGTANGLLDANVEKLTANQRAIVLNAIALDEKLNPALDDFAETSGGLANQTRIMQAQFKDMLITLGQNLLPIALEVVSGLNKLLEGFNKLPAGAQKAIIGLGAFLAILGPLISGIGTLITAVTSISGFMGSLGVTLPAVAASFSGVGVAITGSVLPALGAFLVAAAPVILMLAAIAAGIYFIYWAFKNNIGGITTTVQQLWFIVKYAFGKIVQFIGEVADAVTDYFGFILKEGDYLNDGLMKFPEHLRGMVAKVGQVVASMRDFIVRAFRIDLTGLGQFIIRSLITGLLGGNSQLAAAVMNIAKTILNTFKRSLDARSPSRKAMYFGEMTSQGFLEGMAAAMNANRIADLLTRPVEQVAGASSLVVNQHFSTGLTVREAHRIVAENNEEMMRGLGSALGAY